jgi:tripartite-type tricarboxylate transporter receptor subunit TctC
MKTVAAALFTAAGLSVALTTMPLAHAGDFYEGKTLNLYIGYGPGAFDNYGRLLARYLPAHVPGKPGIVVRAMPGAATLTLTNYLYNIAPKDGTAFGSVHERVAIEPLYANPSARFEPLKLNWIGSIHSQTMVCIAWHEAKVKTLQDAMTTELVMGASGVSGTSFVGPRVLNAVLGTKLKIIAGYSTTDGMDVFLAMERGEVEGRCIGWAGLKTAVPQWLEQKKINVLVQMATTKNPELPDVPLIMDLAKSEEDRQSLNLLFGTQIMGRPYVAPPDVPADRVAILRKAFLDTLKDPALLAEANTRGYDIDPASGEDIEKRLAQVYATAPDIVQRVKDFENAK